MSARLHLPPIDKQVYKTCLSALIVALFYHYVPGGRNPCFACIGAVYGMGSSFKEAFHHWAHQADGHVAQHAADRDKKK